MRSHIPTISLFISLLLLTGNGCASLARLVPWGNGDSPDAEYADDPVAAAAMRMRSPASAVTEDGANDKGWNHRYSPPAETITYGMGMDEVSIIWGQPTNVDSAGDEQEGNQRWTYYSGLSGRYGLGSKRVVYFEKGRVAGWKN